MIHEIKLTQASTWFLGLLLVRPRWAKTEGDAYRASKIAVTLLPDLDAPDKVVRGESQRSAIKDEPEWCKTITTFHLTDRQRDCVKTCLKSCICDAAIPNGPWTLELITAFGLVPEDDISDEKSSAVPTPSPKSATLAGQVSATQS